MDACHQNYCFKGPAGLGGNRMLQTRKLPQCSTLSGVKSRHVLHGRMPAIRSVLQPVSRTNPSQLLQPSILTEVPLAEERSAATAMKPSREAWKVIPDIWGNLADESPDAVAIFDPHRPGQPRLTYKELDDSILAFSEGLKSLGLLKGECVSLLSENSHRWLIADQGVMSCGACDAVRGTRSSAQELQYIIKHSDSTGLIVENVETLQKVLPLLQDKGESLPLKFVVVLWPANDGASSDRTTSMSPSSSPSLPIPVLGFNDVLAAGKTRMANNGKPERFAEGIREDDIATMVFTSGTTGEPKAVMLTHANLMHQVRAYQKVLLFGQGEVLLSLLPPWHMYERSCEYFALSQGAQLIYSGVKTFKEDLVKYPPDYFVAVPLVFEVLYNGVQKKLAAASAARAAIAKWLISASLKFMDSLRAWEGAALPRIGPHGVDDSRQEGRSEEDEKRKAMVDVIISGALALLLYPLHLLAKKLVYSKVKAAIPIRKVAVSGGGSLAPHVDKFFEALGITLLNGYGLTETSPVLTVRTPATNVLGTVGTPISYTQIKVVSPESGATLPDGVRGLVKGKGPQIMKGYYKNPAATAATIDADGWFTTGDIGWITPASSWGPSRNTGRQLVLEGRAKDTIVLANGENVEPAWVEEAALCSPVISQMMLIGQDQRRVSALIVPNTEELERMALERRAVQVGSADEPVTESERRSIVRNELDRWLSAAGCGTNERIGHFALLEEPFTVENGMLTATMKMKRDVIYKKYEDVCLSLRSP